MNLIIIITSVNFIIVSFSAQTNYLNPTQTTQTSSISSLLMNKAQGLFKPKYDSVSKFSNKQGFKKNYMIWSLVGVFNLGTNGYFYNNQIEMPFQHQKMAINYSKSKSIGFDLMIRGLDFFKKRLYISPGIGIERNKYRFQNTQQAISTENDTTRFVEDRLITYYKYKLGVTYLQVPILIGLRIGNLSKKWINIQAGVIGGYNLGAITKASYILGGAKHNSKVKDDFNLSPFKLDAVARVSFGKIGLFGRYSFNSLFNGKKAPSFRPFSIGLTFGSV